MSARLPFDLIIAGVGGQGSLFASRVVAEAAFEQGVSVRVAETYGVAQRGGAVCSQIRLGYGVAGPLIPKRACPLIVGLDPIEALRRAGEYLAPGGDVLLNQHVHQPLETKMGREPRLEISTIREELGKLGAGDIRELDALALAKESGDATAGNVVMIGALLTMDAFPLTSDAMAAALIAVGTPARAETNRLALSKGMTAFAPASGKVHDPNGLDG